MSEPIQPSTTPPSPAPFQPQPLAAAGCGKAALLGCGVLLLLLGIGAVVFVIKAHDVLRWGVGWTRAQIERALPADLPAAERERWEAAFTAAADKVTGDDPDPAALGLFQSEIQRVLPQLDKGLSRDEVLRMTAALERVAGKEPATEPRSEPSPGEDGAPGAVPDDEPPAEQPPAGAEPAPSEAGG